MPRFDHYYERQTLRPIDAPLKWLPEWQVDIEKDSDAWGRQGTCNLAADVEKQDEWVAFEFDTSIEELTRVALKQSEEWHLANPDARKVALRAQMTWTEQRAADEKEKREDSERWFRAMYGNRWM